MAEGSNIEEELGDLLFSAVNVSRFVKVDTEEALTRATDKFIDRFRRVEAQAEAEGRSMEEMSLAELDARGARKTRIKAKPSDRWGDGAICASGSRF